MESPENQELLPVIIAADQQSIIARAEEAIARHPRYELAGVCANAMLATALAGKVNPAVVLLAECLRGSTTNDAVTYLHSEVPTTEVIVLCSDVHTRELDLIENIFAALGVAEADLLDRALDSIAMFLDAAPGQHLDSPDRRLRDDARLRQEWNTVVAERRDMGRREVDSSTVRSLPTSS